MKKSKRLILVLILFITFCGKETPTGPTLEEQINSLLEEGWTLYSNKDYTNAILKFSEVIDLDKDNVQAYLGRGWCSAWLAFGSDDQTYVSAVDDFDRILLKEPENLDAKAGIAFILLVINQYEGAISAAHFVLEKESNYVFTYDNRISAADLILVLAQSYYYLANYEKVVEQLTLLDPGNNHPVDNPEILLAQIQSLWGNV